MTQSARPILFGRILASIGLIALGWNGAVTGFWGTAREAGPLLGRLGLLACVVALLIGIDLGLNALGLFTSDKLRTGGEAIDERVPTPLQFSLVYMSSLVAGVLPITLIPTLGRGPAVAWIFAIGGAQFLVAASGRPWWLYGTIRRAGWFRNITSDI
jgi:hypothetical protein